MNVLEITEKIKNSSKEVCSLLVLKEGKEIMSQYFNGSQEEQIQKLYSCSKSISSIMVGVALDLNPKFSVETLISELAPELNFDSARAKQLKLKHFLNQTTGFKWMETGRPFAPGHSGYDMEQSENWMEFLFDQPISTDPGERFSYNTGVSHLLPFLASRICGISQKQLFEDYLVRPMNLGEYTWDTDPQGNFAGGKGLQMTPKALLKFGELIINQGKYKGRQIISKSYLKDSTKAQSRGHIYYGTYGYQWWLKNWEEGPTRPKEEYNIICGIGFGGQFLFVVPDWELIVVFTGKLIGAENFEYPQQIFREDILASFK